ncbi:MAG TPA: hypothetical protein VH157_04150, partial [Bryobacteraceae bacterium]|nr:hypothetical protein [Bryobacteraceae bacterium]
MKRLLIVLLCVATANVARSETQKLAPDVRNVDRDASIDVIVQYRTPPAETHHNKITGRGGVLNGSLEIVNGAHYSIPARLLEELAADPDVLYVTPDRPVHSTLDYANPTVNANIALQYGYIGTGIGVAVI